jgi:hypothetical protein
MPTIRGSYEELLSLEAYESQGTALVAAKLRFGAKDGQRTWQQCRRMLHCRAKHHFGGD